MLSKESLLGLLWVHLEFSFGELLTECMEFLNMEPQELFGYYKFIIEDYMYGKKAPSPKTQKFILKKLRDMIKEKKFN